jgi:hypothetical protein
LDLDGWDESNSFSPQTAALQLQLNIAVDLLDILSEPQILPPCSKSRMKIITTELTDIQKKKK